MAKSGKVFPIEVRRPQASMADIEAFEANVAAKGQAVAGAPAPKRATSSRRRDVTTSRSHDAETGPGTLNNPRRRADGVKTRATTVHLPIDLLRKLSVHAAERGVRLSQVVTEAVRVHLGKG